MTKLIEFKVPAEFNSKIKYVNELWASRRETRLHTLNRITNYLFVLNTGALLAALTYVATKPTNIPIQSSIWLFAAGIFLSVAHATVDYYTSERAFAAYTKNVEELYGNKLDWEVFVDRSEKRLPYDWLMHLLGWLGATVFFIGLVYGVANISHL